MRRLVALLVAAFALDPTAIAAPIIHGVTPGHKCNTAGTDQFVGRLGNKKTGLAIKHVTHAAVLRWAPPGVMLTMDYREDRVTVHLDQNRTVTMIRCG